MRDSGVRGATRGSRAAGGKSTRPRRATINDVARLAGVSKKTVSRVTNEFPSVTTATRQRVLEAIKLVNYVPDPQARGLAFRRSMLVGFIYDNPNPQYIVSAQQGLLEGLKGTGFELIVRPCNRASADFLPEMRALIEQRRLAGVVLFPSVSEDERLAHLLLELGCPYVRVASVSLDEPAKSLVTHDARGAADAARHIAGLGHTRIGHISGPMTFRSAHERRRGFVAGLTEAGLTLPERYVRQAGYTFESGLEAARELLRLRSPPSAIFTGNDEMAVGVYQAARDCGIGIPGELSVIGYDDSPIASRVWPALTTVRLPIVDMARTAAAMLFAQEEGRTLSAPPVTPALVVRASTARAA